MCAEVFQGPSFLSDLSLYLRTLLYGFVLDTLHPQPYVCVIESFVSSTFPESTNPSALGQVIGQSEDSTSI